MSVEYARDTTAWQPWQLEYRFGALMIFPPPGVIEDVDALRARHDPSSYAMCQAHISLSEPLPGPLSDGAAHELARAIARVEPFTIHYGPVAAPLPYPGVIYRIAPQRALRELRAAIHATSIFIGVEGRRDDVPAHMTIAEFISLERSSELAAELAASARVGEFRCERVDYAVPDDAVRFRRVAAWPLAAVDR